MGAPKTARVLLVDEKDTAGGMWNTAYDYVRLHQPHPMFTVGNNKWGWNKPRHYLAARDEVQSHLANALDPIAGRVSLTTQFGTRAARCDEVATGKGPMAEIVLHPKGAPNDMRTIRAARAIHAQGINYTVAPPLALASDKVVSIIPQDLRATLEAHPDAPVYVAGGGKTGMDTILAALGQNPKRQVTLINGRGTNFYNRTKNIPRGLKRWTSGTLLSRAFRDLAHHFDGDNEDQLIDYIRTTYATDPETENGVFLYGLQSEDEHARIQSGLTETHRDYVVDVVDTETGPVMTLRSGAEVPVPEGAIFVNCCGSFFRGDELAEGAPFLSENGVIMSINARSSIHFLTSVAGFFGAHLLYRDLLRDQGFYAIDLEALFRKNRNAWVGATAAQAYLSQVRAVQLLPMMLLDRCGLDLDRWFPLPRRMVGLMQLKSNAKADIAVCQRTLDRVAERFDVPCAPV